MKHRRKRQNPQVCDYCRLVHHYYSLATTPKQKRHYMARFKVHRKIVHKNPPTKRRIKIARIAVKIAYRLYRKFKADGVPEFIINRIPQEIRPYVIATLDASGVKIVKKNPINLYRIRFKNGGSRMIEATTAKGAIRIEKHRQNALPPWIRSKILSAKKEYKGS